MKSVVNILITMCALSACDANPTYLASLYAKAVSGEQMGDYEISRIKDGIDVHPQMATRSLRRIAEWEDVWEKSYEEAMKLKNLHFEPSEADHFYLYYLARVIAIQNDDAEMALHALSYGAELFFVSTDFEKLENEIERYGGRDQIMSDLEAMFDSPSQRLAEQVNHELAIFFRGKTETPSFRDGRAGPNWAEIRSMSMRPIMHWGWPARRNEYVPENTSPTEREQDYMWSRSRLFDWVIQSNDVVYYDGVLEHFVWNEQSSKDSDRFDVSSRAWKFLVDNVATQQNKIVREIQEVDERALGEVDELEWQEVHNRLRVLIKLLRIVNEPEAVAVSCKKILSYPPNSPIDDFMIIYLGSLNRQNSSCLGHVTTQAYTAPSSEYGPLLSRLLRAYEPSQSELFEMLEYRYDNGGFSPDASEASGTIMRFAALLEEKESAKQQYRERICSSDRFLDLVGHQVLWLMEDYEYLAESLTRCGSFERASTYLNTGIGVLESAAHSWASANGYYLAPNL